MSETTNVQPPQELFAPPSPPEPRIEENKPRKLAQRDKLTTFLRRGTNLQRYGRYVILGYAAVTLLAVGALILSWFWGVPALYRWSFEGLESITDYYKPVLGVLGLFFLLFLPPGLISLPIQQASKIFQLYLEQNENSPKQELKKARKAEQIAADQLQELALSDPTGLIQLTQYSKAQLEQYYARSLIQAKSTFINSIISMWLGFIVILGGLGLLLFAPKLMGTEAPTDVLNIIILAGGVVIELVSALFLWLYRSEIVQQTYLYDRQMYMHGILMSFRIADQMKNRAKADDAKARIVDSMLEREWRIARPAQSSSKGMQSLLPKPQAPPPASGNGQEEAAATT